MTYHQMLFYYIGLSVAILAGIVAILWVIINYVPSGITKLKIKSDHVFWWKWAVTWRDHIKMVDGSIRMLDDPAITKHYKCQRLGKLAIFSLKR